MSLVFVLALGLSTLAWRTFRSTSKTITVDIREIAFSVLIGYGLVFTSALPLIFFNAWSFPKQTAIIVLLSAIPLARFTRLVYRRQIQFQWELPGLKLGVWSLTILLGIALQWHGIYYFYAANDPSAYLASANHFSRTGSFIHEQKLTRLGYGEKETELAPLLNVESAPEEWLAPRNYGVIPISLEKGTGGYHGLFGAPLFFALGINLFGEDNLLRIHWLHFIASGILVTSILTLLLGASSWAPWLAPFLLVISPLIPLTFREPLSEPLAQVFFLGLVFCVLQMRGERKSTARATFLLCLAGALCTRISALLYLPFIGLYVFWVLPKKLIKPAVLALGTVVAVCLTMVWQTSPYYASKLIADYLNMVMRNFGREVSVVSTLPLLVVALVAFIVALPWLRRLALRVKKFAIRRTVWNRLWQLYFVFLGLCLVYRYGKLVTKLTHNFGGYPFVLFNLDSLIFYGSPALIGLGLAFWLLRGTKSYSSQSLFITTFVAFLLFFYGVYRFIPLTLQTNFQRYLVIELLPLAVIGFVAWITPRWNRVGKRNFAVAAASLTLVWSGAMTFALNRSDIADNARDAYARLRHLTSEVKNPVVVLVQPTWLEIAYTMPLMNAFDIPVAFINEPFSYRAKAGINALTRLGFEPIYAVSSTKSSGTPWRVFKDCHQYATFGLAAPPLELAQSCVSLDFYRSERLDFLEPVATTSAKHWFGLQTDGAKLCRENSRGALRITLRFPSAVDMPKTILDGVNTGETRSFSEGKHSMRVESRLPLKKFACDRTQNVDIYFPGQRAEIVSIEWVNEEPTTLAHQR